MIRTVIFVLGLAALGAAPGLAKPATAAAPGGGASAAMPTCAAGDQVVWVNTKSNVYHLRGDRYFGQTKAGKYACESAAKASGAHLARGSSKSGSAGGATTTGSGTMPSEEAAGVATGKRSRHHRGGAAVPAASATP